MSSSFIIRNVAEIFVDFEICGFVVKFWSKLFKFSLIGSNSVKSGQIWSNLGNLKIWKKWLAKWAKIVRGGTLRKGIFAKTLFFTGRFDPLNGVPGQFARRRKEAFFHKLWMVFYNPWSNSGSKGVRTAAEKGWNRLSEKNAKMSFLVTFARKRTSLRRPIWPPRWRHRGSGHKRSFRIWVKINDFA